jgi:predicted short-subunit dehydrogenase-like oxidoreductase (DUF2520 family)
MNPLSLNIVGAGRVGKTLGRLWHGKNIFVLRSVITHTPENADAVKFIGAGTSALSPAAVTLITVPDDSIEAVCRSLIFEKGAVVFHCSGALPSSVLASAKKQGAYIASLHPVKSFADPARAVETFAGTWCAAEGDKEALAILVPAFEAIGARIFAVDPAQKTAYHTASVFASNYMPPLMEAALDCLARAGVARPDALRILEPIVRETVDNVFALGPAGALTGPAARGDAGTVARQKEALAAWNGDYAALYELLARLASGLAKKR